MITTVTSEIQEEVKKHSTKFFQQVKGLLQSLTNDVLEKVPQFDVMQREEEICMEKMMRIVQIPPWALETIISSFWNFIKMPTFPIFSQFWLLTSFDV